MDFQEMDIDPAALETDGQTIVRRLCLGLDRLRKVEYFDGGLGLADFLEDQTFFPDALDFLAAQVMTDEKLALPACCQPEQEEKNPSPA